MTVNGDSSAPAGGGPGEGRDWVPESCTLPTSQHPTRLAEFDALFADAVVGGRRPEPTRLRLALDPRWEGVAQRLAERESQCCAFFAFDFSHTAGKLYLDIAVPVGREPILDAMAKQATEADR